MRLVWAQSHPPLVVRGEASMEDYYSFYFNKRVFGPTEDYWAAAMTVAFGALMAVLFLAAVVRA